MGHESAVDSRLNLRNRPPLTVPSEISSIVAGRAQMFAEAEAFEARQNLEAAASTE
ncbi:MAG TPA: hypothetical protein VII84_04690 [Acidimicrobiales bacterium]